MTTFEKRHILFIEGPAGAGKTTLCLALTEKCKQFGVPSTYVPEFSNTLRGSSLASLLARFSPESSNLWPEAVFIHCIADKFVNLTAPATHIDQSIVIVDRGFITQAVLGIPEISDDTNRTFAQRMLMLTSEWLREKYNVSTLILKPSLAENMNRLSQRLGRSLSPLEHETMRREVDAYAALADSKVATNLGVRMVDCVASPDAIADDILSRYFDNHRRPEIK